MENEVVETDTVEYEPPTVADLGSLEELTLTGNTVDIVEGLKT